MEMEIVVQPELSQEAALDYQYTIKYLPLHKAALIDDWATAYDIIKKDSLAATTKITRVGETLLHIAVGTNSSHNMVEKLIEYISINDSSQFRAGTNAGENALHIAAKTGNIKAAKKLVAKDYEITQTVTLQGHSPLLLAAKSAKKKTLVYLLSVTRNVVDEDGRSPFQGVVGGELMAYTITAGFYDVALDILNKYPLLAIEEDNMKKISIQWLATKPHDFLSGRSLWFWEKFIYFCIPVKSRRSLNANLQNAASQPSANNGVLGLCRLNKLIWRLLRYTLPFINTIGDSKLVHTQSDQLMRALCKIIMETNDHTIMWGTLEVALHIAAVNGIHELVEECLQCLPDLTTSAQNGSPWIFVAIKYRHLKVYNLVYQMTGHIALIATKTNDGENALHKVARIDFPHRVSIVTGAALQLQRELQWFKEIENFVQPEFKDIKNKDNKTPKMLFTEEHADMVVNGEKWMKDTSTSSMVVSALIFTVAFAAAFTVPGGHKDDGTPNLLKDRIFMLFILSDATALFASATSVLMFLAVLTSRFAEKDFLYALPKRLGIGLLSLFISIAATMVAFSATLRLVLREQLAWIAIPVGVLACIPVVFFVLLQFPLLVELVVSTYGPCIFHKQNNLILY